MVLFSLYKTTSCRQEMFMSLNFREFQILVFGFLFGSFLVLFPFYYNYGQKTKNTHQRWHLEDLHEERSDNESLSDQLYSEVRVLCLIMTHPKNHRTKAIHVKNTWGKRCNKLLFVSSSQDELLDTLVLPIQDSRETLWNKTKMTFTHVHKNYLNDYDWFLKADDDNYVVLENLRFMLSQYNTDIALYFGHRFAAPQLGEGYMAGGGYILSRKAIKKFIEDLLPTSKQCQSQVGSEDFQIGKCLAHNAIFVDGRDEKHQKRFFPVGVTEHFKKSADPSYWYFKSLYYSVPQASTDCCSKYPIEFHYIHPQEMYGLEYLMYTVHPFGLNRNLGEKLPKKLTLEEIIKASDVPSEASNYQHHKFYHNFGKSEVSK